MFDYMRELEKRTAHTVHRYRDHPHLASVKMLWWALRHVFFVSQKSSFKDKSTHIRVHMIGGIGDFCVNMRYVKALSRHLGMKIAVSVDPSFDGVLDALIYGQDFACKAEDKIYDIELSVCRYPFVEYVARTRKLDAAALDYVKRIQNFYAEYYQLYENDFIGYSFCKIKGIKRVNQADFDFSLDLNNTNYRINTRLDKEKVLQKFGLSEDAYITVQTGGGKHFTKYGTDVRQWSDESWKIFVSEFKQHCPQLKVVQIGTEGQKEIADVDLNLCGKTSFDESLILLGCSKKHLQQEGGMVYVRHYLNAKPTYVLFGPTDPEFYNFSENIPLSSKTECCCEHLYRHWMVSCLKSDNVERACTQLPEPCAVCREILRN